ncbi:MAG: SCO1664 family protein [Chloroflexota bacterium]|nr:SCO1664 family protein [Chloroflexota bacterium]
MRSRSRLIRLRNLPDQLAASHHLLTPEEVEGLLTEGEIRGGALAPWGSNYTYFVTVCSGDLEMAAVYKPRRGEAPLIDFPSGTLYLREQAAYAVSDCLGWDLVPHTVIRDDGPYGPGTLQVYVDAEGPPHVYSLTADDLPDLQKLVVFDVIVNNADRKPAHCFKGVNHGLWAIDHGLTFHARPKLRTVIWDFCGDPIPKPLLRDLQERRDDRTQRAGLERELAKLLSTREVDAFWRRVDDVLERRRFPLLDPRFNIPYGFA